MRARRVKTVTLLGHSVQVGFQIRPVGVADWPWNKPIHWKIAQFVEDHAPVPQCWSSMVDWALGPDMDGMEWRERLSTLLPWRPLPQGCRDSAAENGTCYCGKVGRADIVARPDGPRSTVLVPDPCAGGCTHDHDHAVGGWNPLCSNCHGCWPRDASQTSTGVDAPPDERAATPSAPSAAAGAGRAADAPGPSCPSAFPSDGA